MDIKNLAEMLHAWSWENGWHNNDETEDHFIERTCNNMHDEISELHQAWRENKLHDQCDKDTARPLSYLEEELADIVIRALDTAERLDVNIKKAIMIKHEYNKTRPFGHGNKRS